MTTENAYTHIENLIALIPEITPDSITNHVVSSDGGAKTILFAFAAGQELSEHMSPRPVVLHFLSGEAEVMMDGDTFIVKANSWLLIPPRLLHSVHAKTDTYMLLMMLQIGRAHV